MNQQQADAIRRENEARSRAQWAKTNAAFARNNARAETQRQADVRSQSERNHQQLMKNIAEGGRRMREAQAEASSWSREDAATQSSYSGGGSRGKSKGGGLLFILVAIGAIVAFDHSGSSGKSGSAQPHSAAYENSSPQLSGDRVPTATPSPSAPADADQGQPAGTETRSAGNQPVPADADATTSAANTTDTNPATPAAAPVTSTDPAPESPTPLSATAADPPLAAAPLPLEPLYRIGATYPVAALQTRPTGPVTVVIGVQPNGSVTSVTPESGDPLLVPAAIKAAWQWRFKPYPFEPGQGVHTLRVAFEFLPPPANGFSPSQSGRGFYPTAPGREYRPG